MRSESNAHVPSFDQWLKHLFDHPVTNPAWYWDRSTYVAPPPHKVGLDYITLLFSNAKELLALYTDGQLNQGLWFLVDNSCSSQMFALFGSDLPWEQRRNCIRSMNRLFSDMFRSRCTSHLSHIDESGASELNLVCYMWWDIMPVYGRPNDPLYAEEDAEILAVMQACLSLDSVACQESALHGLGHWEMHYPDLVHRTIDEFLNQDMRDELRQYAYDAREGYVL